MTQDIFEINGHKAAEIISDDIEINTVQDALDWMATVYYDGADNLILYEQNLSPDFFDLRTGLAGEILQKAANYHIKVAIVGDFSRYTSKSLQAFILECNRGRQIFFVPDRETAVHKLIDQTDRN